MVSGRTSSKLGEKIVDFVMDNSDLHIGVRGRLPAQVFRTEHAPWVWRAKIFQVRVLRT